MYLHMIPAHTVNISLSSSYYNTDASQSISFKDKNDAKMCERIPCKLSAFLAPLNAVTHVVGKTLAEVTLLPLAHLDASAGDRVQAVQLPGMTSISLRAMTMPGWEGRSCLHRRILLQSPAVPKILKPFFESLMIDSTWPMRQNVIEAAVGTFHFEIGQ